jgi:hypothetical protein
MRLMMLLPALLATGFLHSAQAQGEGFNYFNGLSGDEWVKANENEARAHFAKWQAATGAERVQEAQAVHFYAWRAEKPELIDAVIADGRLAETEVKVPATAQAVPVTIKLEVPKVPAPYEGYLVWRRITPGAFEISDRESAAPWRRRTGMAGRVSARRALDYDGAAGAGRARLHFQRRREVYTRDQVRESAARSGLA